MKTHTLKIIISLILVSLFISCGDDSPTENPTEENNSECMSYQNIHDIVQDARHVFFINELEGWSIGVSGALLQNKTILLHTIDGGHSWSVINDDLNFDSFSMYVNSSTFKFHFTDSNHGYLSLDFGMDGNHAYEQYYYTNDKGVTWNALPLPTSDPNDIFENYGMGVNDTQMVYLSKVEYPGETAITTPASVTVAIASLLLTHVPPEDGES